MRGLFSLCFWNRWNADIWSFLHFMSDDLLPVLLSLVEISMDTFNDRRSACTLRRKLCRWIWLAGCMWIAFFSNLRRILRSGKYSIPRVGNDFQSLVCLFYRKSRLIPPKVLNWRWVHSTYCFPPCLPTCTCVTDFPATLSMSRPRYFFFSFIDFLNNDINMYCLRFIWIFKSSEVEGTETCKRSPK